MAPQFLNDFSKEVMTPKNVKKIFIFMEKIFANFSSQNITSKFYCYFSPKNFVIFRIKSIILFPAAIIRILISMQTSSSFQDFFYFLFECAAIFIEIILNKIEETLSDLIETPGNLIQDFLDSIANSLDESHPIGRPLQKVVLWLGGVISTVCVLISGLVKGIGSILSGLIGGLLRIIGSILVLNGPQILIGAWDILSGTLSAIILTGGHVIILIQSILLLQPHRRPLNEKEKRILSKIFQSSLALYNIRLVEGWCGFFMYDNRPFNFGNMVFTKDFRVSDEPDLLVHECTHTWQFQNVGARYLADAILVLTFMKNPYDWQNEINMGKDRWVLFNRESQAQFMEDIFMKGKIEGSGSKRVGVFYDADNETKVGRFSVKKRNFTELANDAVDTVRGRISTRLSRLFFG